MKNTSSFISTVYEKYYRLIFIENNKLKGYIGQNISQYFTQKRFYFKSDSTNECLSNIGNIDVTFA